MKFPAPLYSGPSVETASACLVLVHGRGAEAEGMLQLYDALDVPSLAAIAPQAAGNTWYPHSFLAPLDENQPYLDRSLAQLDAIVIDLLSRKIPGDKIAIVGFSQGACLSLEYAARFPRKFGALMGLTGGLIGPPGTPRNYSGSLDGTPVFLGTSDPDPHVPFARVKETSEVLSKMGAKVELRRYQGMGHTINDDELNACRALLQRISPSREG
jgi:predicted esterase